jgi:hypothetical protein
MKIETKRFRPWWLTLVDGTNFNGTWGNGIKHDGTVQTKRGILRMVYACIACININIIINNIIIHDLFTPPTLFGVAGIVFGDTVDMLQNGH